ncbi:retrovirus-related pol polyprotein from transposon TNT 1-94 [Tanacetum coccineum]
MLYIQGKENGEMLKGSVINGPYKFKSEITTKDTYGVTDIRREERLEDLKGDDKLCYDSDIKDIYTLINHYQTAKEIWDRIKELMEGNMAKQCTARKRVKNYEWFKDKMLLAQAQEAGVVLDEEQQDFLADSLEETDDCEDLQLQATTNFKTDQIDAYDSDCDDEATTNAIFMEKISPISSLNDDTVAPRYDSDTLSEVPHYDTYHDSDMLNSNIQELGYIKNIVSTNESYDELKSNSDVISYTDYMLTIGDDADNYVPPPVQKDDMMLSVIEQIKSQVEKCTKVNQELKSKIESLTSELEQYKDRVRVLGYAVKDGHSEQEAYRNRELYTVINDRNRKETLILAEESRLKLLEKQTINNFISLLYQVLLSLFQNPKFFLKKLPSTSQVLKNLNKARDLPTKFDECIKRRTTLSPHEIGSWEQSDIKEVKEMKDIIEQMEDEVDKCFVVKKCFEIEKKQLLINNDRLLEENIASDIICTYLRSLNDVDNCGKCKSLVIVLLDLQESNKIQKIEDENVSLAFQVSSLVKERKHIKLEYKKLYDSIKQTRAKMKLQTNSSQQKLNDQISENNKLRAQLKGKFFESQTNHNGTSVNIKLSKPSTSGTKLYSVSSFPKSKVIPKVVEKNDLSKSVTSHLTTNKIIEKCTKVLAPGLLKIETEPINAYFKNNRVVHRDYLRVTKVHVATLQEILEQSRALKPLDEHIGYASKFAARIQELLVTKLTIETITKDYAVKQNTRKTDNTMLPSTGRVSSTNASGSRPRSNTKKDRIPQPSSRSKKNKVEAHHRKFKSSANKNNHVLDYNANVKNVSLSKNYDIVFLSCNECLFSANHDAFVVQYLKKMQKHKVSKSAKQKVKREWKPTGRIFETIGLKWIPTGRTFNLVGKPCPLLLLMTRVDLLSGSRRSNLYTISMADMMKSSLICLLSKASKTKSWLWHRRLSYLKFGTINKLAKQGIVKGLPKLKYTKDHLCSTCQMGKIKKESHPHKPETSTNEKLQMLHMDLCGPMLVEIINKKRYIIVIIDDYSHFTWVKFLRTKDEAPEIIIKILKQAQVSLNATVRYLRTDNGIEFLNQTLRNYMEEVGITHMTSTTRTPQQNDVVERCNYTLVEAARTMLIFSKSPLFPWAEAVATICYTQNRSFIHTRYNKTSYEQLRDRKPKLKYLHVFGALCYPTNDFEDLGKL